MSTLKTLKGKPKLLGTKSRLETQPQVKEVLRPWIQKSKLEKGDMRSMQKALEIAEVKTKYSKAIGIGQVTMWIRALRLLPHRVSVVHIVPAYLVCVPFSRTTS